MSQLDSFNWVIQSRHFVHLAKNRGARERQQLHIATTAHGRMCQLLLAEMASWDQNSQGQMGQNLCFRLPSPKKETVEVVVSWWGGRTWCQEVWASLNRLNLWRFHVVVCLSVPLPSRWALKQSTWWPAWIRYTSNMEIVRLFYCVCIPQKNTFTAFTYLCPNQICGHVSSVYFLHSSLNFKMRRIRIVTGWQARWNRPRNRPSGTLSRRFPLSQCQTRALVCTWCTCPAGKHESSKSRWWKWLEMFGGLFQENE